MHETMRAKFKYFIAKFPQKYFSICVTVVILNVHFRSPQTHRMAPWVKRVFIQFLPKLLFIKRPQYNFETRYVLTLLHNGKIVISKIHLKLYFM